MTISALQDKSVVLIGGGKMGEAMASGWISSGVVSAAGITVAEPSDERRAQLDGLGIRAVASALEALPADIVVLAVKPQVLPGVVMELGDAVAGALVVSVAAGVTCARLESLLPSGSAVVRVMPNTPAMVGEGMAVVSGGSTARDEEIRLVATMFESLGRAVVLDERYQNASTGISGSGPAYFALIIEALVDAGREAGLSEAVSRELAVQTMRGTAALLEKGDMTPRRLIDAVSSPGGTTVAALSVLEERGVKDAFSAAVAAAVSRAEELGA